MKKLLILTLSLVALAACGASSQAPPADAVSPPATTQAAPVVASIPTPQHANLFRPNGHPVVIPPPPVYKYVEDLDFLLEHLQNNFGYFDNARLELDYDIEATIRQLQEYLLATYDGQELSVLHFYRHLTFAFEGVNFIGHFQFDPPDAFNPFMTRELIDLIDYYYNSRGNLMLEVWAGVSTSATRRHERGIRTRSFYRGPEVAAAFQEAFENQDLEAMNAVWDLHENTPNIHHRILEETQVAYMAMNAMRFPEQNTRAAIAERQEIVQGLADFYCQIVDYPHLIIDIRGNSGGWRYVFLDYVLAPLWQDREGLDRAEIYFDFYLFGHSNLRMPDAIRSPLNDNIHEISNDSLLLDPLLRTKEDLLATAYLPELNYDNIARLTHGFRTRIQPQLTPPPQFRDCGFDGEIWLLTDGLSGSASHISAYIAKASGFATLVGEPTGGNYAGASFRANRSLPNSRIMFTYDQAALFTNRGRSMEHGIQPHYPNRPGLCALETVLAIIAEQEGN